MSYILDALHKAEKTRQQSTETPQHQNITTQVTSKDSSKRTLFLVLVVASSLVLVWFLLPPKQEQTSTQIVIKAESQPPITPLSMQQNTNPKKENIQPTDTMESVPSQVIPTLLGLPEHVRAKLPPITISGHMYANIAKKRMVIINNQLMHEGSYLAENLSLSAITPQGIMLTFEGINFSMSTSEHWPY